MTFHNGRKRSVAPCGFYYDMSRIYGNSPNNNDSSLDLSRPRLKFCVYPQRYATLGLRPLVATPLVLDTPAASLFYFFRFALFTLRGLPPSFPFSRDESFFAFVFALPPRLPSSAK